jgi:hypothetical protein
LQHALWRYETMWLPLLAAVTTKHIEFPKADHGNDVQPQSAMNSQIAKLRADFAPIINSMSSEDLTPPLDVAWVWYLHRLTPLQYLEDVSNVAGCPIAPSASSAFYFEVDNESRSAQAWNNAFAKSGSENINVQYFPEYLASIYSEPGKVVRRALITGSVRGIKFSSLMLYDIYEAAKSHRGTLSVAVRSEVVTPGYFVRAITRYDDFMRLQAMHKLAFLYAPEDVSFIWRAHAASTADYLNDDLIGRALSSRAGSEKSNMAHPQARHLPTEHQDTALGAPLSMEATMQIWSEVYADAKGPFLVPTAEVPRCPGQQRDGYLQDCLRAVLEASTDGNGDGIIDDEDRKGANHGTNEEGLVPKSTLLSPSSPRSADPFRAKNSKGKEQRDHLGLRSELQSSSPSARAATDTTGNNSKGRSVLSKLTFRLVSRKADADAGVPLDDTAGNTRTDGERTGAPDTTKVVGDDDAERFGRKERGERHLAAQKEKLGHGGQKKANEGLDRAQWIRGLSLCAVGLVFVIFGIIYMRKLPKTSSSGVLLFLAGLLAFLLAALIWLRPDHERRKQKREDRNRRREDKEADEREKQESKANSQKYLDGVQMNSFVSNEAMIAIGGDGLVHLPAAAVADSSV